MQQLVLSNGLTVLYQKIPSRTVAVQIMVQIGSNQEKSGERGVAHMVEHLVFEGTNKRKDGNEIAKIIENVGGEFNAYTSNHRTCYYVKVLKKHSARAIELLSDIMQNSLMNEKDFKRERGVVFKEIDMFLDEPKSFQWLELEKMLFKKNNAKFPSSGIKADLNKMTRDDVFKFYKTHYHPKNIVVAITGDISNWRSLVKENFADWKSMAKSSRPKVIEPLLKKNLHQNIKKPSYSSNYMLLGANCAARGHKDSYVLDLIQAHLGKGQSGTLFHELRGKRGLVYDVAVEYGSDIDFGYFVIFASCSKKQKDEVKKIIKKEMDKLQEITVKELNNAKTFLEGDYYLDVEDVQKYADQLLFWHDIKDAKLLTDYIRNVKKVSVADIRRVAKKYFTQFAIVELEGRK